MRFRKTTPETLARDLDKLANFVRELSKDYDADAAVLRAQLTEWFNARLDQLVNDDVFGTEGASQLFNRNQHEAKTSHLLRQREPRAGVECRLLLHQPARGRHRSALLGR